MRRRRRRRENNRNEEEEVEEEGNGVKKILHFIHEIKTIAYDVIYVNLNYDIILS